MKFKVGDIIKVKYGKVDKINSDNHSHSYEVIDIFEPEDCVRIFEKYELMFLDNDGEIRIVENFCMIIDSLCEIDLVEIRKRKLKSIKI
jgi:hypothetical protein